MLNELLIVFSNFENVKRSSSYGSFANYVTLLGGGEGR